MIIGWYGSYFFAIFLHNNRILPKGKYNSVKLISQKENALREKRL